MQECDKALRAAVGARDERPSASQLAQRYLQLRMRSQDERGLALEQEPEAFFEYDNTQNRANHIHTVWRDFDGDFGRDILRELTATPRTCTDRRRTASG